MKAMNWHKGVRSVLVIAGLAAAMAFPSMARRAQQSSTQEPTGDAVADAARKAREQKKRDANKPKKVYTDEDVNHAVPEAAVPSGEKAAEGTTAASQKGASNQASGAAGPETSQDRETKWRKRFKDAYAKLAQTEKELDILQREDNKAQMQYYSDPQKAMNEQYSRKDINEKTAKITAKKQEVAQLKQQISDMEDELRKDGGDPGWAAP